MAVGRVTPGKPIWRKEHGDLPDRRTPPGEEEDPATKPPDDEQDDKKQERPDDEGSPGGIDEYA